MHEPDPEEALANRKTSGWMGKCSEIFRSLQSHILPASSVNINVTDRRSDNSLRE